MSIKKEDRALLDESIRGHIAKAKSAYEDAVEAACLRGDDVDLDAMEKACKRYMLLLKAQSLLTDVCA
jgi:hypothetical protein